MATRNFRPIDTDSTSVLGGLILLAIVLVVVVVVQIGRAWSSERSRQWAVAWMKPGSVEPGHQVKLNGSTVGEVVEVGFPARRLRVDVASSSDPTRVDGTHLAAGDSTWLVSSAGTVRLKLEALNRLTVALPGGAGSIVLRDSAGYWQASGDTAVIAGTSAWETIRQCARPRRGRCVNRGDKLQIGNLVLRWQGIEPVVRVLVSLNRSDIEKALAPRTVGSDTVKVDRDLLVGVELRETGAFGIGKQGLKVVLPGQDPGLVTVRPDFWPIMRYDAPTSWVVRPDSQLAVELVTIESLDLVQVMAMAAYLSDPALRNTPPRTRFEDIIDNTRGAIGGAGSALASARSSLDRIRDVSAIDGGNGMVGRLVLQPPDQRRLREAIDALPDILDQIEKLAATATTAVDSTGRSVRELTTRIDSTLGTIEPELVRALQGARTLEDSLVTLTKELEATLASAKKTGKPVGIALLVKLLASTLLDIAKLGGLR
jgi:hypothetical protein